MSDDMIYDGLEAAQKLVLRHAPSLGYAVLDEVVHRQRCITLARVNFSALDLASHLTGDEDSELEEEEVGEESEDDASIDGESLDEIADQPPQDHEAPSPWGAADEPAAGEAHATALDPDTLRLCHAVFRWLQTEVDQFMASRPLCIFKVRLHQPKGRYLESVRFKVENPGYRPARAQRPSPPPSAGAQTPIVTPPPQLPATVPQPPPAASAAQALIDTQRPNQAVALALGANGRGQLIYLDQESIPETRAWRALGDATERLLRMTTTTFGNIVELQSQTVVHQAAQLDKQGALIESLADKLLVARKVQEHSESEQKSEEGQLKVRQELGRTFLSELGSFGRLVASSKLGVPPELAELAEVVTSSPELAEAIRDPEVRAMLKDEKTKKELAQLLLLASKRNGGDPPKAA